VLQPRAKTRLLPDELAAPSDALTLADAAAPQAATHCIALRNGNPAMQRGRHPEGEHPLSNAERQARYRARREARQVAPVVRNRRPVDRRTRSQRWHDTVAGLLALQTEYAVWYDALPDSLRETATAAALQAIVELDLDELAAIAPPRGYGRD
jgi:hypothetical protein